MCVHRAQHLEQTPGFDVSNLLVSFVLRRMAYLPHTVVPVRILSGGAAVHVRVHVPTMRPVHVRVHVPTMRPVHVCVHVPTMRPCFRCVPDACVG